MATEHERIARIRERFRVGDGRGTVEVGIGDDCAVLLGSEGPQVWTIDSAVEGVHFRRDILDLRAIGHRAFMAAASDLAAMGASAWAALSALTLPTDLTDAELDELLAGIARAAEACRCPVVGGNLARGSELSLTTTLLGIPAHRALLRAGAREGDQLCLTGPVGGAALGLEALLAGRRAGLSADFIHAFSSPRARLDLAEALGRTATSAIDVSDGLVQDAAHLGQASQLCASIDYERIPRLPGLERLALDLGVDARRALLAGGDDYEVLFTAAPDAEVGAWATPIGRMVRGPGAVRVLDGAGRAIPLEAAGFDHFR